MGRRYEYEEYVEFLSGADDLSEDTLKAKEAFEERVEVLLEKRLETTEDEEDYDYDSDEVYYLTFATVLGHGVGLWEEREPWHEEFLEIVEKDRKLSQLAEELEILAYDDRKPDEDKLESNVVIGDERNKSYLSVEGEYIGEFPDLEEALEKWADIRDKGDVYLDVYYINERGNIDLLNEKGEIVRSWV